jgi:hypothetical protein
MGNFMNNTSNIKSDELNSQSTSISCNNNKYSFDNLPKKITSISCNNDEHSFKNIPKNLTYITFGHKPPKQYSESILMYMDKNVVENTLVNDKKFEKIASTFFDAEEIQNINIDNSNINNSNIINIKNECRILEILQEKKSIEWDNIKIITDNEENNITIKLSNEQDCCEVFELIILNDYVGTLQNNVNLNYYLKLSNISSINDILNTNNFIGSKINGYKIYQQKNYMNNNYVNVEIITDIGIIYIQIHNYHNGYYQHTYCINQGTKSIKMDDI